MVETHEVQDQHLEEPRCDTRTQTLFVVGAREITMSVDATAHT